MLQGNYIRSLKKNDVVIGLGAGTITNLSKELLNLNKEVVQVGD